MISSFSEAGTSDGGNIVVGWDRTPAARAALLAAVVGGVAVWLAWPQKPVDTPTEVAELGKFEDVTGDLAIGDLEAPAAGSSTTIPIFKCS